MINQYHKIGIGIVSCNRQDFFTKCFNSISTTTYDLVVVNDGDEYTNINTLQQQKQFTYIKNKENIGVGKSKNKLFRELLSRGCTDIFIIEDDIIVKDIRVFNEYIRAKDITGIQHFSFGYHGPANKGGVSKGVPTPRYIIDYGSIKIAINTHSVGAFCYFTKEVLDKVGLMDEEYMLAFEHVDLDYRIAKAGLTTPYWNFPDISNSLDYLDEIECSEKSSTIRPRKDWQNNIQKGAELFKKKHGHLPAWQNCVPDTSYSDLVGLLQQYKDRAYIDQNKGKYINSIDVIILSLVKDEESLKTTRDCVSSYLRVGGDYIHKIFVIESNKDSDYDFPRFVEYNKVEVIKPGIEFNYNKFYNIGLEKCTKEFVMGPNNDVILQPDCITTILASFSRNKDLVSISPIDRNWHNHSLTKYPDKYKLCYGYDISEHIMGCCFCCRRDVFKTIGYLDEQFYFFYQDNDYAECLKANNLKHALHTGAHIQHKIGQSSNIGDSKFKYTEENMGYQGNLFKQKWWNNKKFTKFKEYTV